MRAPLKYRGYWIHKVDDRPLLMGPNPHLVYAVTRPRSRKILRRAESVPGAMLLIDWLIFHAEHPEGDPR